MLWPCPVSHKIRPYKQQLLKTELLFLIQSKPLSNLVFPQHVHVLTFPGSGIIEGADMVERGSEVLRNVVSDLAAASMAVAVGSITDNPAKASHHQLEVKTFFFFFFFFVLTLRRKNLYLLQGV